MSSNVADAVDHYTNLIGRQDERHHHTLTATPASNGSKRRPIPSPLQETTTARSNSGDGNASSRAAQSQEQASTSNHSLQDSLHSPVDERGVRAPNPGKRAPRNPELDKLRSAVTRDALREQAQEKDIPSTAAPTSGQLRNAPTAAQCSSPPISPTMLSNSRVRADPRFPDGRPMMPRTASIDSTVSSLSSTSQKPNASYRVEPAVTQDVAAIIATAGSTEAAVGKLLNEKNQAASHNAQLWRLVEKQRAMILGLHKDLEKSLKEKERYRKKLKDHLVQSQSAPALTGAQAGEDIMTRDPSESPAMSSEKKDGLLTRTMRDFSLNSRKASDSSDAPSLLAGRSDTSQYAVGTASSSSGLPATPQSSNSGNTARDAERSGPTPLGHSERHVPPPISVQNDHTRTPPMSPKGAESQYDQISPRQGKGPLASPESIQPPGHGMSSPKSATRKAPPAPLQLSPKPVPNVTNNIIDPSDSEYEDDPESARAEQSMRGRRKTREEDDHEREVAAQEEMEHRSRSKKQSKSKSSKPRTGESEALPVTTAPQPNAVEPMSEPLARVPAFQPTADPAAIIRQRARSDAAGMLQKSATAPSLMSPGLPMSPRPIDKPLNSPMPRAPNKMLNSLPMSPKGMAGLPLSPRAPRQPLPLPPQTPLTFASPHLARAEAYHQQSHSQQTSISDTLKPSPNTSPDFERPSTGSDPNPKSPGEVYRGLVTEQYPDLLLPPNALPSIFVKTSSPRLKPSRQSMIMPRQSDESPVLTLSVHERSDNKQLWKVEKTVAALAALDTQVKAVCSFRDRFPEKAVFSGHAPSRIDARRVAIDWYLEKMLDAVHNDTAAKVVCKFLSTDAIGADGGDYFGAASTMDNRPDTPVLKQTRPQRAGYLTKRGKNFGGWKARYFVLEGPNLRYFEAPGGAHMGSIKLQNAQIGKQSPQTHTSQEDEENQYRHAFLILEPKKKDSSNLVRHVLCAESDDERDAWVEALLQYVDYKDDETDSMKGVSYVKPGPDISGARSPRLQKSMNDLKPTSQSREAAQSDALRTMAYGDTVPGEAPLIGPTIADAVDAPMTPHDSNFGPVQETAANHPMISAPTNLHVISNTENWGMKPPPTPQSLAKEKKRSMFAAFRGRSSSDLAPGVASAASTSQDSRPHTGMRAVFGVPLAEAVEFAYPADATTELPAVVYRCIEYLTMKGAIAEEGIFRLSGSNTVIKSLKDRFNAEGDVNLAAEEHHYDIHAVASLLKLYLRELPASILTRESHLEFLQCLEMHGKDKIVALNVLVHRLPTANRALLQALSAFLLSIVSNAEVNKMNVRNVGIVFAPTLNVPAPLISSFVEDQTTIFGPAMDETESHISAANGTIHSTDLRSPRKQMFSDLPTPAYHQTTFDSTGMVPMQPTYHHQQLAPQGEGAFGSLNDALRSPVMTTSSRADVKSRRRESAMMMLNPPSSGGLAVGGGQQPLKKTSMSRLREEEGARF